MNSLFAEASEIWDLDTLYADLSSSKGKRLTPAEKVHLRGLLCGKSPAEIADALNKSSKGVEVDLSNTIYQYVKSLVGKNNGKLENWRNISEWLGAAGYRKLPDVEVEGGDRFSVKLVVKSARVILENNQIALDINLRIITPKPDDIKDDDDESKTGGLEFNDLKTNFSTESLN